MRDCAKSSLEILNPSNYAVFTDLDGSLLDHFTYSAEAASEALALLQLSNVPIIPNTSKTRAELKDLQDQLNLDGPFVVENGAAIYIPDSFLVESSDANDGFLVKEWGVRRDKLIDCAVKLSAKFKFEAFHTFTVNRLIELTGLSERAAKQALQREFTEPILWQDTDRAFQNFREVVAKEGLVAQRGGRFVHLMGQHNKALPMQWYQSIARSPKSKPIHTVALGDGENDIDMLAAAQSPIIIRSPVHQPIHVPGRDDAQLTGLFGPAGWNQAILNLFNSEHTDR